MQRESNCIEEANSRSYILYKLEDREGTETLSLWIREKVPQSCIGLLAGFVSGKEKTPLKNEKADLCVEGRVTHPETNCCNKAREWSIQKCRCHPVIVFEERCKK